MLYFGTTPTYTTIADVSLEDLKERATAIHYFGLGFIQIKLGGCERIHFYTKRLPPITSKEDIHDHRYSFYSFVLHGTYHHEVFSIQEGDTHLLEEESCVDPNKKDNKRLAVSDKKSAPCSVAKIGEEWITAGGSYYIDKNTFHRVDTEEAVTFLIREKPSKEKARVLYEKNSSRVCPFSKIIPEETLWVIVEDILSTIHTVNKTKSTS